MAWRLLYFLILKLNWLNLFIPHWIWRQSSSWRQRIQFIQYLVLWRFLINNLSVCFQKLKTFQLVSQKCSFSKSHHIQQWKLSFLNDSNLIKSNKYQLCYFFNWLNLSEQTCNSLNQIVILINVRSIISTVWNSSDELSEHT